MEATEIVKLVEKTIVNEVANRECATSYRDLIIGFVSASDPEFAKLSERIKYRHLMPDELLNGARSIVCFYLPFVPEIVYANQKDKKQVAREWGGGI